jgi:hypothetical protein
MHQFLRGTRRLQTAAGNVTALPAAQGRAIVASRLR